MALELVNKLPYDHPYRWDGTLFGGQKLWRPDELGTSLALWLDAEDEASITLNGSTVSQWSDKSGNDNHAIQGAAAKQPIYTDSQYLTFDGADDGFFIPLISNATFNMISVHETSDLQHLRIRGQSTSYYGFVAQDSSDSTILSSNFGSPSLYVNGELESPTDRDDIYTLLSTGSGVIGGTIGGDTSAWTEMRLFDYDATYSFAGKVREIVITTGTLSTTDRQKLEGYLAWKWGLEANLPADHPYKSTPPTV